MPHDSPAHGPDGVGRRADRRRADRRRVVLDLLRGSPEPLDVGEVAERLGIHRNTARFHLENLVAHGQVVAVDGAASGRGRPPQVFRIADGWDPLGPRQYQSLAEVLVDQLRAAPDPQAAALDAGRRWGARLASGVDTPSTAGDAARALTDSFDELGFRPMRHSVGQAETIDLRHCPFLELTAAPDQLVCRIHLGMLLGAVEEWEAPLDVEGLDPLVRPGLCVARLTRREGERS